MELRSSPDDDCSFLGHASLDMLLKRYGHLTDKTRQEAILKFDQG